MRWLDQAAINANARIGGAASQASSRWVQGAPPRKAPIHSSIIGTQIHGSTNNASPPSTANGIQGWKRSPIARSPWKAKEAQPCEAFQIRTGENTAAASATAR